MFRLNFNKYQKEKDNTNKDKSTVPENETTLLQDNKIPDPDIGFPSLDDIEMSLRFERKK